MGENASERGCDVEGSIRQEGCLEAKRRVKRRRDECMLAYVAPARRDIAASFEEWEENGSEVMGMLRL